MDKLLTREGTFSDIETIVKFQKEMALETEEKILLESSIKLGVTEVIRDKQKGTYLSNHYLLIVGNFQLKLCCVFYSAREIIN